MVTTELIRGVGIGRGTAVGPVLRMPDPVPDPADARRERSAEDEQARATAALAATSAQLRARGEAAGGTAAEVLDALAMMADDPALAPVRARLAELVRRHRRGE